MGLVALVTAIPIAAAAVGRVCGMRRTKRSWPGWPPVMRRRRSCSCGGSSAACSGAALPIVGDRGRAEDVAQEAFVRAWRHADAYDARRASVTTWLLTITRNLAIDTVRVERVRPADPSARSTSHRPAAGTG